MGRRLTQEPAQDNRGIWVYVNNLTEKKTKMAHENI